MWCVCYCGKNVMLSNFLVVLLSTFDFAELKKDIYIYILYIYIYMCVCVCVSVCLCL